MKWRKAECREGGKQLRMTEWIMKSELIDPNKLECVGWASDELLNQQAVIGG